MIPTIKYITGRFNHFNALCFNATLPEIPIVLSRATTFLGQIRYRRINSLTGKTTYSHFKLAVSACFNLSDDELDDVILHEMIHLHILWNQMQDTAPHGRLFRSLMQQINSTYNRNITISHRNKPEQITNSATTRHFICVFTLKNGHTYFLKSAQSRIFALWEQMERHTDIIDFTWYQTYNPYFNNYRKTLTIRGYVLPRNMLSEQLSDAKTLTRKGDLIYISSPSDK